MEEELFMTPFSVSKANIIFQEALLSSPQFWKKFSKLKAEYRDAQCLKPDIGNTVLDFGPGFIFKKIREDLSLTDSERHAFSMVLQDHLVVCPKCSKAEEVVRFIKESLLNVFCDLQENKGVKRVDSVRMLLDLQARRIIRSADEDTSQS